MLTKDQLRQILDELRDRETRSSLDPYRELLIGMRRRRYSYREISRLLTERCGLEISHSAVHDFVKRHCPELSGGCPSLKSGGTRQSDPATARTESRESRAEPEQPQAVRERIAAMKRRPRLAANDEPEFQFDPSQPLRLKDEDD
jgi:hypothetical protein